MLAPGPDQGSNHWTAKEPHKGKLKFTFSLLYTKIAYYSYRSALCCFWLSDSAEERFIPAPPAPSSDRLFHPVESLHCFQFFTKHSFLLLSILVISTVLNLKLQWIETKLFRASARVSGIIFRSGNAEWKSKSAYNLHEECYILLRGRCGTNFCCFSVAHGVQGSGECRPLVEATRDALSVENLKAILKYWNLECFLSDPVNWPHRLLPARPLCP